MFTDLQKLLDTLWRRPSVSAQGASLTNLSQVRSAMRCSVQDCGDVPTQRLHRRITLARTHRELWALRAEVYEIISKGHCQSIAADRIRTLAGHFEGWIDPTESRSHVPLRRRAGTGR